MAPVDTFSSALTADIAKRLPPVDIINLRRLIRYSGEIREIYNRYVKSAVIIQKQWRRHKTRGRDYGLHTGTSILDETRYISQMRRFKIPRTLIFHTVMPRMRRVFPRSSWHVFGNIAYVDVEPRSSIICDIVAVPQCNVFMIRDADNGCIVNCDTVVPMYTLDKIRLAVFVANRPSYICYTEVYCPRVSEYATISNVRVARGIFAINNNLNPHMIPT